MNLFSFTAHFGSEQDCRNYFKSQRDLQGVVCAQCGCRDHYWKKDKSSYECKTCKYRTSLKKGTIMENSNLRFLVWYKTMFLMSVTKKGFSAKETEAIGHEKIRTGLGNGSQTKKSNGESRCALHTGRDDRI